MLLVAIGFTNNKASFTDDVRILFGQMEYYYSQVPILIDECNRLRKLR